ncbi:hypothetical protein Q7C36_020953 [Tachysurus vachellii]|uniref:Uncharacterized protein n=2 Tax=Tachysurus vachellii TaxID=175792 RepID=A0AA88IVT0_TACVA|nr:hypothetical protein Q7C36_020953 [Tachysurus vachellii]
MKRQVHRYTDSTNSCDRIISFSSPASDGNLQHLSTEEKACIGFLEEIIESTVTEHSDFSSDDSQTFGNTISKKHHCTTRGVHQDMSSCNSFPGTDSWQDLSAEEKDCLKFLEETIDSIEDVGLSTGDAESFPESGCTIVKKHHINQIKTFLVPAPFVLTTSNGSIPTKQGMACAEEKTLPNKDHSRQNDQASSDDALH